MTIRIGDVTIGGGVLQAIIKDDNPTIHTVGTLGQLYVSKLTNTVFVCKKIDTSTTPFSYHWLALNSTAEDYNDFLDDIDEIQTALETTTNNSIVKIDPADNGITVTYGDDETETIYHTHTDLSTSIDNKADKNLSNITASYDYIFSTVTYGGGESGKTKWRNGRFEQWGVATTNETGETEFNIHEAFKDMNFSIFIEPREMGNWFHYAYPSANQKFKTRISDSYGTVRAIKIQWRAIGYWK